MYAPTIRNSGEPNDGIYVKLPNFLQEVKRSNVGEVAGDFNAY